MGDTEQLRARIEAQVAAKRRKAAEAEPRSGHHAAPVADAELPMHGAPAGHAAPASIEPQPLTPSTDSSLALPTGATPPTPVNGNGSGPHVAPISFLAADPAATDPTVVAARADDAARQRRLEWATAAAQERELARHGEVEGARREAEQQAEVVRLAEAVRDAEAALRAEAERRVESERRLAELEQRLALIETAQSAAPDRPGTAAGFDTAEQQPAAASAPTTEAGAAPPTSLVAPEPTAQPRKPAELSAATAARWPAPAAAPEPELQPVPHPTEPAQSPAIEAPTDTAPLAPRHAVALPSTVRSSAEAPHTRRTGRLVLRLAVMVVVAALAAVLLRTFVIASYYIPSASMEPTLHGCSGCNNDHVLVDKLSYHLHAVHRGDVVVFHRPVGAPTNEKVLIKRVIGLPGDVLTDRNDVIYVNGRPLHEPYLNSACSGTQNFPTAPVTVPAHEVYVMGDNRCDSSDSRIFGPISESSIIGRAFVIVWPLGRLHYL